MRPTTLRDARKLGLVPSVTTILRCAEKPGLRRYFDRMMWEAACTTPRLPDQSDEDHFNACLDWADEHSRLAREKGTEIHGAIEKWLRNEGVTEDMKLFVHAADEALNEAGVDHSPWEEVGTSAYGSTKIKMIPSALFLR